MYMVIKGKKYDRSCLDLAVHLAKDGSISKPDAEAIWTDVLDGPGVTKCEADTVKYVCKKYKLSKGVTINCSILAMVYFSDFQYPTFSTTGR